MSLRWYQDDYGDTSSGRLAFLPAVYTGLLICLVGAGLAIAEVAMGKALGVGAAIGGVGGALVLAAFGFKGWQRQSEAKIAGQSPAGGGM